MEDRRGAVGACRSEPNALSRAAARAFLLVGLWALPDAAFAVPLGGGEVSTARSRECADHALHGDDDAIVNLLEKATDRTPIETAQLGTAYRRLGRRDDARKLLKGCPTADCAVVLGRLELEDGDRRAAVKLLTAAARKHGKSLPLLVLTGRALYAVGQDVAARRLLDPLADLYAAGKVRAVPEMVAVAESLAANGFFKDANAVLADASEAVVDKAERKQVEGVWGQLFLGKYNFRDADTAFSRVLTLDPQDEAAVVGMARIDLDSDHDIAKARKRLDGLLAKRPKSPHALVARAEVAIHDESMDQAREYLDQAAAIAPSAPDLLAVRYAWALLNDDKKLAASTLRTAAKLDPTDGSPHLVAARYLEMAHRYDEVRAELGRALERDPELWQAHAALGLAWSRVVDDEKALTHLTTAFRNDPFNVRTANLLNVLYDGVLRHMVVLKGEKVNLRVHRRDQRALQRTVLPFLQESYATLAERYAMAAKPPLQVEIFPTTEQFSVRTVGLPRLGAHAVCFGHLITSRSPIEAPFNWKMVLHHELAHVFHIQATAGRVPRWLTEGLAMMESAWLDPRYHMIQERELYDRARDGKLTPVARFNLAFSQARTMADIVGAYYQAMWLVRFLDAKWGFAKLRTLVAEHKSGQSTEALISKVYGQPAEAIDKAFAAWVLHELARFDKDFRPTATRLAQAAKAPLAENASQRAAQAQSTLRSWARSDEAGDAAGALAAARGVASDAIAEADADVVCPAVFLAMEAATARGAAKKAAAFGEALIAVPNGRCDGVAQRLAVARVLAGDAETRGKAEAHLDAAHAIDLRDPRVLVQRLALARKTRSLDAAAERGVLHKLLLLLPNQLQPAERLAKLAWDELAPLHGLDAIAAREESTAAATGTSAPNGSDPNGADPSGADPMQGAGAPAPAAAKTAGPTAAGATAAGARGAGSKVAAPALTPAKRKALIAELRLAQAQIEEASPANRLAALFEARRMVAEGQGKASLPIYRLAADRSNRARHRAEAWCELERVATAEKAEDDAKEAARRCAVARRGGKAK
ncbi:MAG: hypothetical protein H6747_10910 [Deltaproteobacteria bacterium]|nr:hypothetical protein [Deltaproteobacteria bacterium]